MESVPAPPHGRYRRGLAGADFSLEANTESTAEPGRFYIFQNGAVILDTDDFAEATSRYNKLCEEFWKARLEDGDRALRVAAAWGLLGLDATNKEAVGVITQDGTAAERKRLEQAQSRRRALRTRQANATAKAAANAPAAAAPAETAAATAEE